MPALCLAAVFIFLAPAPSPTARANISARYGVLVTPQGRRLEYTTKLPVGSRLIYHNKRRYYLANGIYYQPQMLHGRTIYVAVDKTWQVPR
jgi:hypothetical protein